jgi:AcrR family transcriptional regulator
MSPRISAENREAYLQVRRDQILDAATHVFGEKGFEGASVSDIAKAACMGKGTIYLYFKNKEEIFSAILSERSFVPELAQLIQDEQAPFEEVLRKLVENHLEYLERHLPLIRMAITEAYRFPAHAELMYRQIILRGSELLANYLADQAEIRNIRQLRNPCLTAQAIMGLMAAYLYSQELLGGKNIMPIPHEAWTEEVMQLIISGIQPDGG